ncbi:MAG: (2Fe-2S)-binding protein [Sphingomonas sp.]|nr:(2Fe-2S)-binding protein [Sphingomonas sp.]
MIVCVCNALCEDEVRRAARAGAPCARSAYAHLGCEVQCGSCLPFAADIVEEAREQLLKVDAAAA